METHEGGCMLPQEIKNGKFILKTGAATTTFASGAVRDTEEGKPAFELIPPTALKRVANVYAAGKSKYSSDNWAKGMPFRRIYASLMRHANAFGEQNPEDKEDHLAALVFNAMAIMHFQEIGRTDLDDMFKWYENSVSSDLYERDSTSHQIGIKDI